MSVRLKPLPHGGWESASHSLRLREREPLHRARRPSPRVLSPSFSVCCQTQSISDRAESTYRPCSLPPFARSRILEQNALLLRCAWCGTKAARALKCRIVRRLKWDTSPAEGFQTITLSTWTFLRGRKKLMEQVLSVSLFQSLS